MKKFFEKHKILTSTLIFLLILFLPVPSGAKFIDPTSLFSEFLKINWIRFIKSCGSLPIFIKMVIVAPIGGMIIAFLFEHNKFPTIKEIFYVGKYHLFTGVLTLTAILVFFTASSEIVDYLSKLGSVLFLFVGVKFIANKSFMSITLEKDDNESDHH